MNLPEELFILLK